MNGKDVGLILDLTTHLELVHQLLEVDLSVARENRHRFQRQLLLERPVEGEICSPEAAPTEELPDLPLILQDLEKMGLLLLIQFKLLILR